MPQRRNFGVWRGQRGACSSICSCASSAQYRTVPLVQLLMHREASWTGLHYVVCFSPHCHRAVLLIVVSALVTASALAPAPHTQAQRQGTFFSFRSGELFSLVCGQLCRRRHQSPSGGGEGRRCGTNRWRSP